MIINPIQNSNLILQTSNPRPIAWIVSENEDKIINIAPYSLFTPLSFNPPTIIVSFKPKEDRKPKDTLENINKTKKCTICMVKAEDKEIMHQTSQEISSNQSEADKFGIDTKKILKEYPPIISSSPIAYFCDFEQKITLRGDNTVPIILRIEKVFIDENIIKQKEPLFIDFNGVGHIVGDRYRI